MYHSLNRDIASLIQFGMHSGLISGPLLGGVPRRFLGHPEHFLSLIICAVEPGLLAVSPTNLIPKLMTNARQPLAGFLASWGVVMLHVLVELSSSPEPKPARTGQAEQI